MMKSSVAILVILFCWRQASTASVHKTSATSTHTGEKIKGSCGGVYRNQISGYVASPGFPDENYPLNVNCTYVIHAPPGHVIAFESYEMNLEETDTIMGLCMYDYIKLYDNNKLLGKDVQSYCGKSPIYKNSTTSNTLRIDFISDFSKTARGFLIHWKILDPNDQPDSFNCSFDGYFPMCPGWESPSVKEYQWTIRRGKTDTASTGPSADHTTNSYAGRYAFIETSKRKENSTAILVSPLVRSSSENNCLRLWYHMYGRTMGGLEVQKIDGMGSEVISRIEGDHGNRWIHKQINVHIRDRNTKFWFVGRCGPSYLSDIAIDDISITEGKCPQEVKIENAIVQKDTPMDFGQQDICPGNTHFITCAPKCNQTCETGPTPPPCEEECVERCACPHYAPIWHINKCIPFEMCPPQRSSKGKPDIYNNLYTTILELISIIIPKTNE